MWDSLWDWVRHSRSETQRLADVITNAPPHPTTATSDGNHDGECYEEGDATEAARVSRCDSPAAAEEGKCDGNRHNRRGSEEEEDMRCDRAHDLHKKKSIPSGEDDTALDAVDSRKTTTTTTATSSGKVVTELSQWRVSGLVWFPPETHEAVMEGAPPPSTPLEHLRALAAVDADGLFANVQHTVPMGYGDNGTQEVDGGSESIAAKLQLWPNVAEWDDSGPTTSATASWMSEGYHVLRKLGFTMVHFGERIGGQHADRGGKREDEEEEENDDVSSGDWKARSAKAAAAVMVSWEHSDLPSTQARIKRLRGTCPVIHTQLYPPKTALAPPLANDGDGHDAQPPRCMYVFVASVAGGLAGSVSFVERSGGVFQLTIDRDDLLNHRVAVYRLTYSSDPQRSAAVTAAAAARNIRDRLHPLEAAASIPSSLTPPALPSWIAAHFSPNEIELVANYEFQRPALSVACGSRLFLGSNTDVSAAAAAVTTKISCRTVSFVESRSPTIGDARSLCVGLDKLRFLSAPLEVASARAIWEEFEYRYQAIGGATTAEGAGPDDAIGVTGLGHRTASSTEGAALVDEDDHDSGIRSRCHCAVLELEVLDSPSCRVALPRMLRMIQHSLDGWRERRAAERRSLDGVTTAASLASGASCLRFSDVGVFQRTSRGEADPVALDPIQSTLGNADVESGAPRSAAVPPVDDGDLAPRVAPTPASNSTTNAATALQALFSDCADTYQFVALPPTVLIEPRESISAKVLCDDLALPAVPSVPPTKEDVSLVARGAATTIAQLSVGTADLRNHPATLSPPQRNLFHRDEDTCATIDAHIRDIVRDLYSSSGATDGLLTLSNVEREHCRGEGEEVRSPSHRGRSTGAALRAKRERSPGHCSDNERNVAELRDAVERVSAVVHNSFRLLEEVHSRFCASVLLPSDHPFQTHPDRCTVREQNVDDVDRGLSLCGHEVAASFSDGMEWSEMDGSVSSTLLVSPAEFVACPKQPPPLSRHSRTRCSSQLLLTPPSSSHCRPTREQLQQKRPPHAHAVGLPRDGNRDTTQRLHCMDVPLSARVAAVKVPISTTATTNRSGSAPFLDDQRGNHRCNHRKLTSNESHARKPEMVSCHSQRPAVGRRFAYPAVHAPLPSWRTKVGHPRDSGFRGEEEESDDRRRNVRCSTSAGTTATAATTTSSEWWWTTEWFPSPSVAFPPSPPPPPPRPAASVFLFDSTFR